MDHHFQSYLESILGCPIISASSVSGGDISNVLLLNTREDRLIIKYLKSKENLGIFTSESMGLKKIRQSQSIAVPQVYFQDKYENTGFIIMEYIENKRPEAKDFQTLADHLLRMHNNSNDAYGLPQNNHIGKLSQSNTFNRSWIDFYVRERLVPQLELGIKLNYLSRKEVASQDTIEKVCNAFLQETKPSLVHGDLWGGNFLISTNGTPYLIDPAIYYGDKIVDIAMSKLFGGFDNNFYDQYFKLNNSDKPSKQKIDIYQLYFLLVNLNHFGLSYYPQVKKILNRYFS